MSKQILIALQTKLDDLENYQDINIESRLNALKEELHFYVLNFIYHHPKYSQWIMYGGSALRIIHGLNRMSVDLDFEIPVQITNEFLKELKNEIKKYFLINYDAKNDFLEITIKNKRGLLLKFKTGEKLNFGYASKKTHLKIDLNYFVAPKVRVENRPINRDQFSFVVKTYNMAGLMASKIAAIFLRGPRGVGEKTYPHKGRDIYDLLWYMNQQIIPDFDYLSTKKINLKNPKELFNKLTIEMNKVSNKNLEQDLLPLFFDQNLVQNWLANWRENYLQLKENYQIFLVKNLKKIIISEEFGTDNLFFTYQYDTEENKLVKITYAISDYWFLYQKKININTNNKVNNKIEFFDKNWKLSSTRKKLIEQYATLFYQKNKDYFKKTNQVILGNTISTKLIRIATKDLNQKKQICLDLPALISCELDDLLK